MPALLAFLVSAAFIAYCIGSLVAIFGQVVTDVQIAKRYTIPRLRAQMNADVDTKLADMRAALGADMRALMPAAPSAEERDAARAQLAQAVAEAAQAAVPGAVQLAVGEAVKGRMGALSAQGVDARASKALTENALKQRVGEKYGLKGLGALRLLAAVDKDLYGIGLDAVNFAPGSLDSWLEEHADKFTIGAGTAKPKSNLVRV